MTFPRIILKPKRAQPFFARHPWVFAGAIDRVEGEPADGAEVEVVSSADHFIARGLFNGQSKIRVRLYSWQPDRELDRAFSSRPPRRGHPVPRRARPAWAGPGLPAGVQRSGRPVGLHD